MFLERLLWKRRKFFLTIRQKSYHTKLEIFCSMSESFWLNVRKRQKKHFPQQKTLSCGHVDCSYSNFPENILTNGRIFFAECNETVKKKNFLKMIFLRVFLWISKKHFWKSCYFFVSEAQKNFAEISKT